MTHFTAINIIFNPKSTGRSQELAERLKVDLLAISPQEKISLIATEYAGHAETLACELALTSPRPLIISSSGDGGYHEVVNGLMKAISQGAKPAAGLLPAGNANDHFRNLPPGNLVEAIAQGRKSTIDLLKLTAAANGNPLERFAHSYIGLGLSPQVGRRLNQTNLNRLNEAWLVIRSVMKLHPVRLELGGQVRAYDSLIASNVRTMSKVLELSAAAAPDDGQFEIVVHPHRSKLRLISSLLKASTVGLDEAKPVTSFGFQTVGAVPIQLDGEINNLDTRSRVRIKLEHNALVCVT